jgi:ribosome-binding protein aMBF1 (putative translation factor)
MTRERLSECLALLGWTNVHFARELNRSEAVVRHMLAGRVAVPEDVAQWLETLVKLHRLFPPPGREREMVGNK